MSQFRILVSLLFVSLVVPAGFLKAEVRTEEKSLVKFEGFLGRVVGFFGGKAAREGIISKVAVRGDRKATMNDTTGEIIDLSEEKVYQLDLRKKNYQVTTFAEMRRRMMEAQEKAAKAAKEQPEEVAQPEPGQEMEIDFSVKESGQRNSINGYDCHEVIVTIAMRQKGKTLEEGGGMVMTSNIWMGPDIPELKEIAQFDQRYAEKLEIPYYFGADSADQMAAALAMYPGISQMMAKFQAEKIDMTGTPILTIATMETVKSVEQAAAEKKRQEEGGGNPTSLGGLGGMLGRKIRGNKEETPKTRATIMTLNHELLKVIPAASDSDTAIPAGFKEKK